MTDFKIVPLYDSEDDVWFAGIRTGLRNKPDFHAFSETARAGFADGFISKPEAQGLCDKLNRMTDEEFIEHCPRFYEET